MKNIFILILLVLSAALSAQNHFNFSIDNGYMINSDPGYLRMGLGGSASFMTKSNVPIGFDCNFYTISVSAINYPHTGSTYSLKHFNNGVDDAFHFAKIQIGYRMGIRFPESNGSLASYRGWRKYEGLSFEPRIGTIIYNFSFSNPTTSVSYHLHYTKSHFQISIYGDYGLAKHRTNIGYRTIFACGTSVGICF